MMLASGLRRTPTAPPPHRVADSPDGRTGWAVGQHSNEDRPRPVFQQAAAVEGAWGMTEFGPSSLVRACQRESAAGCGVI